MTDFNNNQFNKPAPVRPTRPGNFPTQKPTPELNRVEPTQPSTQNHPADDFLNPDRYHEPINPAGFPAAAQISHQPQAPQHLPLNPTTDYTNQQPNYQTPTYTPPANTHTTQQPWNPNPGQTSTTPQNTTWNKESIIALTFAILGAALVWFDIRAGLGLIAAIILGHRSLKKNNQTGQKGKPLSIAALIISYLAAAGTLILLAIGLIALLTTVQGEQK